MIKTRRFSSSSSSVWGMYVSREVYIHPSNFLISTTCVCSSMNDVACVHTPLSSFSRQNLFFFKCQQVYIHPSFNRQSICYLRPFLSTACTAIHQPLSHSRKDFSEVCIISIHPSLHVNLQMSDVDKVYLSLRVIIYLHLPRTLFFFSVA